MPNYKVVDADKLDADLTTVADAIRAKTGTEEPLAFPDGWKGAVEGIEPVKVEMASDGPMYVKFKATVPDTVKALGGAIHVYYPQYPKLNNVFQTRGIYEGYAPEVILTSGHYPFANSNPTLEKVVAPKCTRCEGGYWIYGCANLQFFQVGSVGYPVVLLGSDIGLKGCTHKELAIEIYVDAETLSDIPEAVTKYAPWSATQATIVYRNSTTGEVITK